MGRAGEVARRAVAVALLAGLAAFGAVATARAATPGGAAALPVLLATQIPVDLADGLRVIAAPVQLDGSTGDAERDAQLRSRAQAIADTLRDAPVQRFVVEGLVEAIRRHEFVAAASYALFQSVPAGRAVLVITVVPGQVPAKPVAGPDGAFVTAEAKSLPVLYRDDRSLLQVILNGGFGAYATSNPFFGYGSLFTQGNKAARNPAGPGSTSWAEAYVEPGLGGITRLGDTPFYAYGAATYLVSASRGQDIYDAGFRHHGAFERAYAGVLYDLPGKGNVVNVSAGRQVYQLRQGFLISKIPGSTNLGPLAGLWLGPRLAFEKTVVAVAKSGPLTAEGIMLEPTEFPGMQTGTRITGATVGYNDGELVDAALTYLEVPHSTKPYFAPDGSVLATRAGLRTISPSVWFTGIFGVEGLWFKSEFAYQTHADIDMSAYAFALWPGYRADGLPWKPGISYRYATFSGDNPATAAFERYDPLLSGGQNNYVPGLLLSSVLVNSNMRSQRLSLTANPSEQLGLTLEYSVHRAISLDNRGGIGPLQVLASRTWRRRSTSSSASTPASTCTSRACSRPRCPAPPSGRPSAAARATGTLPSCRSI